MDGGTAMRVQSVHHDDGLGRWRIDLCRPRTELADCVAQMWYGEGQVTYRRDRILPNGCSFLLINLGPRQYRILDGDPQQRVPFDDVWYSGMHQSPIDTEAPHGNALLGVAFHPHGARAWLRCDAGDCADKVLPLADLLGNGVLELRDRLLGCVGAAARFDIVERWILARRDPGRDPSALARWASGEIERRAGAVSIVALAREAGVSRKRLAEVFRREIGLAPKALARIHRFRLALSLLDGCEMSWSELAAHCGYYDQSHLIRNFHAFAGMSPGHFARRPRPDDDSVVLV